MVRLLHGLICSNTSLASGVDGCALVRQLLGDTSNILCTDIRTNIVLCVTVNVTETTGVETV